jgi:hypothetical protein
MTTGRRRLLLAATLCAATAAAGLVALPALGASTAATPSFKVLAFYNGTWDAAHIDFDNEAKAWFPQVAAQNNFSWESTTDWSRLSASGLAGYKVIMFLDDAPPASTRVAFQQYMQNGGAWMGFHVAAFNTDPSAWNWYYNTFLGTGGFDRNTWGPTSVTLKIEDRTHPTTAGLAPTITSSVAEWYSWTGNLRSNPDIDVLASIDQSSFPVGTDPTQTWYSGDYPIMWTNRDYKMVYANFGHNAMNYSTNTRLSSTFAQAAQNQFVINSLLWLGGVGSDPSPTGSATPPASQSPPTISPTTWYTTVGKGSSRCVDARGAASTNGTPVQQYTCNATTAQQWQFQPTSGGYVRINSRLNGAQAIDVTNVSTADNAPLQLWTYSGGDNQQWLPVAESDGAYHFVNRHSGKCLDTPGASTTAGVQLGQYTCNGTAAQSFRLTAPA